MKLSKSGYRILNQRYRSVLRKCFLINVGLFFLSAPVMAADVIVSSGEENFNIPTNGTNSEKISVYEGGKLNMTGDWKGWKDGGTTFETDEIYINDGKLSLDKTRIDIIGNEGLFSAQNAIITLKNSSISAEIDQYQAKANFINSSVEIKDSEFIVDGDLNVSNTDEAKYFNLSYSTDADEEYQVEAYNLNFDNTKVNITDNRSLDIDKDGAQQTTVAAKNNLTITNNSDVTLNNNAVLAWNGQVYEEDENGKDIVVAIKGNVEIKDSTLTLNNNSKLLIGAKDDDNPDDKDDEGAAANQATLKMDTATINLNNEASVEFYAKNKELTQIHKTNVYMSDNSSMILNDLKLTGNSKIYVMDEASLTLDTITSQGGSIITGGISNATTPMMFSSMRPFSNTKQTKTEINIKDTVWINAKENEDDVIEDFKFENANVTITESDIETEGNIIVSNSDLKISCINCYSEDEGEEDWSNMVMGENVTISESNVILGDTSRLNNNDKDDAYLGANADFDIENSNITINGNAVLVYEGTVEDNGSGAVNITGSTININDDGKILLGTPEDDSDNNEAPRIASATLNISDSNINLYNNAEISFDMSNPEETTISDTKIKMWDNSSIALNDLSMEHSHIHMKDNSSLSLNNLEMTKSHIILNDNSTLEVKDVTFDKGSSINGKNNKVKFSGNVDFAGFFDPAIADVEGNLTRGGYDDEITYNINTNGTLKYASDSYLYDATKHTHNIGETRQDDNTFTDGKYALNSINFNGGTLDLRNGGASAIKLSSLTLSDVSDLYVDVDLANKKMDTLTADTVTANAKLNIAGLNLISDAKQKETVINFTSDSNLLQKVDYTGQTSDLTALSPVYSYDVEYDNTNGNFTFTRGGGDEAADYNPAVYSATTSAQTVSFIQQGISTEVFKQMSNFSSKSMGLASGDAPYSNNVWASIIGFDDNIDFDNFETIDSEMISVTGGFTSDKNHIGSTEASFGIYAGYLTGESKYTGNKIDQEGAYVGLSSLFNKDNLFFANTINTGFITNKTKHSFGTDKYDSYWAGLSLKGGYDYNLSNTLTLQPHVYVSYTFVNSEDYTSKSGAKIKNDNLNLFEVAPGLKINKDFSNGWNGFAQVRYAFIMDNGGDAKVDSTILPNISTKNYVEYGIGVNKAVNDSWNLSVDVNRRDGGRTGWNGSLTVKYNF